MVEFSVLSLRPHSAMNRDIPREALFKEVWGVKENDSVVTMRSPAHLALILVRQFQNEDEAKRNRAEKGKGHK